MTAETVQSAIESKNQLHFIVHYEQNLSQHPELVIDFPYETYCIRGGHGVGFPSFIQTCIEQKLFLAALSTSEMNAFLINCKCCFAGSWPGDAVDNLDWLFHYDVAHWRIQGGFRRFSIESHFCVLIDNALSKVQELVQTNGEPFSSNFKEH